MIPKYIFTIMFALSCICACTPDCKDITIKKAEWTTRYEAYDIQKDTIIEISEYIDTLVAYSIVSYKTKKEYNKDSQGTTYMTHFLTIRNNNGSYANRFAIKLTGKEYNKISGKWKDMSATSDFVYIAPKETHTFSLKHSDRWRNDKYKYKEADISLQILQEPYHVRHKRKEIKPVTQIYIRRIDSLIIKDTIVNNCACNVDALVERNRTIIKTFERLREEGLIHTHYQHESAQLQENEPRP